MVLLGQSSARMGFCSDRVLFGICHSARAECSDWILFGQNSTRPLSLCSGRVFGRDSVRTEFCSAVVTLLGQSVRTRFCSDKILFGHGHSAGAECLEGILLGQNSARPLSLSWGRVFGRDSAWARFCSATVTLYSQSVRTRSCSGRILFGHGHSVRAECSDTILLGQDYVRPLPWFPPRVSCSVNVNEQELRIFKKNALGDVKDQAEDKANLKPWYTADEKSGKMSTEDLQDLIPEYPLPEGWYARLPGLQEPANYGTKFETGIYEEQVKSGCRLSLHPFALRFFEHYRMAPEQLVPNGWRKLTGLIYLVQTSGYKPDATDFMRVFFEICFVKGVANCPGCHIKLRGGLCIDEPLSEKQLEWAKIIPPKPIPAGLLIPSPPPAILSMSSAETVPLAKGKRKEKQPSAELPPVPKRSRVIPPGRSPRILEQVSIDDDPIFRPRWTLRRDDLGMPDSQVSEQHLLHGILSRDKEVFQTQTHKTFACSFAQAVYTMYASGSEILSRFEMARQVAADEAQQKREAIATLEKRLERAKRKAAEEVTKARDQGIRDFLDGNAGDEWLKKWTEDGLEIYDLGFTKANEMFVEHFPDIPLDDFVLPVVISLSGKTVLLSEAGDAAASHPPEEGPSGDAPEP
ncbi:hypothetical protein RJ639_004896 [Escallonia herrerae]|uniref:Transposase (putative) gypsy type domain-containing protein n=1 Tax=Escallonia herrerae TaxID=1293975 RepID=A0AA88W9Y3_9ASTE|nr:hypothetical protein RJ639_004896 [Escallonia herrerae]